MLCTWYLVPCGLRAHRVESAASPLDALAVCSRPRLLPCCCDHHGLIAAHPENKCHRCETMAQHPELIWIKTVHVARLCGNQNFTARSAGWRSGEEPAPLRH